MRILGEMTVDGRKLQCRVQREADGRERVYMPYLYDRTAEPFSVVLGSTPDYGKQVFSYKRHDIPSAPWGHYDISKLHRIFNTAGSGVPMGEVTLEGPVVRRLISDSGVEPAHLKRMHGNLMWLHSTGILMHWPGGEHTVLDGNHRMVARYLAGLSYMTMWHATYEECKPAMFFIPEHLANMGLT